MARRPLAAGAALLAADAPAAGFELVAGAATLACAAGFEAADEGLTGAAELEAGGA